MSADVVMSVDDVAEALAFYRSSTRFGIDCGLAMSLMSLLERL